MRTHADPADLAAPLLGGQPGRHRAPGGAQWSLRTATAALLLLGLTCVLGVLKTGSCLARGFELPTAANRMCASPVANAALGASFPAAPGRARGDLAGFSPVTWWFVQLAQSTAGPDSAAVIMSFVLLINVLAIAAAGVALLMLARSRAWTAAAFASPVILFSLGQSFDAVGIACALWGVVLLRAWGPGPRSAIGAGALLGFAGIVNPLGFVVLLGLLLHLMTARRSSDGLVAAGSAIIVVGVVTLFDGRIVGRFAAWYADSVDRGTLASLLSYQAGIDTRVLGAVFTGAWLVALAAASALFLRRAARTGEPVGVAAPIAALLAISLLTMPAAPVQNALWLVPFAALCVHRLWVQVGWMLAEAALFAAVSLGDSGTLDSAKGLSPMWVAIFTLLRIAALLAVLMCAWAAAEAPAGTVADPAAGDDGGNRATSPEDPGAAPAAHEVAPAAQDGALGFGPEPATGPAGERAEAQAARSEPTPGAERAPGAESAPAAPGQPAGAHAASEPRA
ncbi:hypothetical protein BRM1_09710 [Brevibacterium sp. BRM-1]|uniref:hypothetical protein n=1 Tax=Brevibacterium sp. BRM-1 TaxID=2999062 RepID=UPI00227DEBF8|nr:hypothetical protein [Brevibacterium sp. BRM-1]WAL39545.1 hypothetical protein BRM1_09710 [Brevibacterium sp. BRM-1]